MKTLVVHTGGVGDFICTLPALRALAATGPLVLAGYPDRLQLAVDDGIAEAAWHLDSIDFGSVFTTPSQRLRAAVQGCRRAVIWMKDDGAIHRALKALGIADVLCVAGIPMSGWSGHATAYYLHSIGEAPAEAAPVLRIPPAGPAAAPHDILIHPGSGSAKKNWPLDQYLALAAHLEQQGRRITWSLGPAEAHLTLPAGATTLPPMPLTQLAQHLAGARLYIGNDSGISHLAAAVGVPSVVIFGPTDARVWRPLGEHVRVVQGNPWPEVGEVVEAT